MNINLPPIKLIPVRNEVDRFGFSYVLSEKFELSKIPRSFCCYLHGWIWRKDLKLEDLGYYFTPRNTPVIVATTFQKEVMMQYGFTNVVAGGLPFAYLNKSNVTRELGSLLVMPPHSMKYYKCPTIGDNLFDFIESIRSEFSEICFCLHADDANNQKVTNILRKKGIHYIVGAHAGDANSLYRMRAIFDRYEYMTTTIMGSHILYAAFCGCRVSLLEDFYCFYSEQAFDHYLWMKNIPDFTERSLDAVNNIQKLKEQFSWLFVDQPKEAVQMRDWANREIGIDNLLDKVQLMNLLGWTSKARVRAITRIVCRRFTDLF